MAKQFPDLRAIAIGNSYEDRICTPLRVMVQMQDGPDVGLYKIALCDGPIASGSAVLIDQITKRAVVKEQSL